MSYRDESGAGCIGLAIILAFTLTIIYFTLQIALYVMGICAVIASFYGVFVGFKNFSQAFRNAHKEANSMPAKPNSIKLFANLYTVQPARLMYFYDAGWFVIRHISQNVWEPTRNDAQKWYERGQHLIDEGKSHFSVGFFQKMWPLIRYYAPGLGFLVGWLVHFIAALVIVGLFIGLQLIFLSAGTLVTTILTLLLGIGTYTYGSFYRVYYRCPDCHEQMKVPVYVCPKCSTKHTRLWPSVYGVFQHTCLGTHNGDLCGQSLPTLTFIGRDKLTARCPNCDRQLEGLGGTNAHIPIVGAPYSGKSTYTIMAVKQFIDKYATQNGLEVALPDSNHQQKYQQSVDTLNAGQFLSKTSSADDSAKALNLELKTVNQAVPNLLYLYDTAGEHTGSDDVAQQQRYFKYVNGVLLIIDPLSIPQVRQKYESELQSKSGAFASREEDLDALFGRLLSLFETKTRSASRNFSQPIAVILTKTDALDIEREIGSIAARRYLQDIPGTVHNEQDAINILVEEFLNSYGADNLVRSLHQYFSNVRFFSCSALGTDADSGKPFEGVRVLEPLLWLLEKSKMLPNKAPLGDRVFRSKPWIKYGLPILITGVLSGIGYVGYALVRWSLDALDLRLPSWQQEQNIREIPVEPVSPDSPDFSPSPTPRQSSSATSQPRVFSETPSSSTRKQAIATPQSFTEKEAYEVIDSWLKAKQRMFAPPYDRQVASVLTTGEQYFKTAGPSGSIDWLEKNSAFYKYGSQKIDSLDVLSSSGKYAAVRAKITEDLVLYNKGRIDYSKTGIKTSVLQYNLEIVDGRWKIASSKILD